MFGLVLVVQAAYMLCNALHVSADAGGIETRRLLFGVIVRRRRLARDRLASIEPFIPSRHQSLLGTQPVFQLVARDTAGSIRLVVGESLRGDALMAHVKAAIERAAGFA
jgi:hypothetical protein